MTRMKSESRAARLQRLRKSLTQFPDIDPPSSWLLAMEGRAAWEIWAGILCYLPLESISPKGDGHPVLVLPGLGASDTSTVLLRRFIDDLGYVSHPWELGRNRGFNEERHMSVEDRLHAIYAAHRKPVTVIGQSLGGVYARELAKIAPSEVRQVITLGSPFSGHPLASTGIRLYEWLSGDNIEDLDFAQHHEIRKTPPVPTTSVYSKLDGIVAWKCSIEDAGPKTESIHLRGATHCGMAFSPAALYLLADRLAQQPGSWKPFAPRGAACLLYGTDDHGAAQ